MRTAAILALFLVAVSCDELKDLPPEGPVVPVIPPSQFAIAGRWDGMTDQGRPLRFDVSDSTVVVNGSLTLHHDCSGGRLVLDLGSYQAEVNGDSFSVTMIWRRDEGSKYYVGRLSISGRFEGDQLARGGFVNSITDKQADNLGVCPLLEWALGGSAKLMRRAALLLAVLAAALGPASAEADIAIMESGKILYVDRFERVDQQVTLYVTGGGVVTVPSEIVRNVVPNEIVEQGEDPQKVSLFPQLEEFISPAASKYGVAPELVAAVIWAESSGDPKAVSHRGARGLMQLMPATAKELGVLRIEDPRENVDGGTRYLRRMLDAHEGDVSLALAAYNAGPDAVRRYRGIPPYRETREYVGRVIRVYERALGGVE